MWIDDEPRHASAPGPAAPPLKPRPSLRGAGGLGAALERWDPGITGARALAVVGLIAALAAGVLLWTGRPEPEPVPPASTGPDSPPPPAAALHARPVAAPTTELPGDPLIVHVTGDVRTPGVVTLPPGSRVTDAVKAAGGLRKNGKVGAVNLARKLTDGEQIVVGSDLPAAPVPPARPAASTGPATPLDLNTATLEQLQELPGVGPVLAQRILDHRAENGLFRTVEQLQDVNGIGERRFADLKDEVHVTPP
ncbi:ComEA family DNA-binding protein [Actinocorallia sp. B10E7]|uniref:ComEA family DNA-binding protein n=1 Tax=Actinocorallia sp. B10E7 TaxID=3153558 RepID=UPI00325D7BCC